MPTEKTEFTNVRREDVNFYRGWKCVKGTIVKCKASTALSCAKQLNFRCREMNWPLPNPRAGFEKPSIARHRLGEATKYACVRKLRDGSFAGYKFKDSVTVSVTASQPYLCAKKLNLECVKAGIPQANPTVGLPPFSGQPVGPKGKRTKFSCVRRTTNGFVGRRKIKDKIVKSFDATSGRKCAQKLNVACKLAGEKTLPNPHVGWPKGHYLGQHTSRRHYAGVKKVPTGFLGIKKHKGGEIKVFDSTSARVCAEKLNFECWLHGATKANTDIGYYIPDGISKRKRLIKTVMLRVGKKKGVEEKRSMFKNRLMKEIIKRSNIGQLEC